METYFITWTPNEIRSDEEEIKVRKQPIANKKYDVCESLMLYEGDPKENIAHYSRMEAPKNTDIFYVVATHSAEDMSYSSHNTLQLALTFDDVLDIFEDHFAEHDHDEDFCSLCKMRDGRQRCALKNKGIFANKRTVTFGTGGGEATISYKLTKVHHNNKRKTHE